MKCNAFGKLLLIPLLLCGLWWAAEEGAAAARVAAASDERAAATDTAHGGAAAHPALWVKAVQLLESSKNLVPGKAIQKIQELDDDGRVKSETDVESSFSLGDAGKPKAEIVKASKDGKDITAEQRKKADEAEKKEAAKEKEAKKDAKGDSEKHSHSISLEDTPFNPEFQKDVRVGETASRELVDSATCRCFEFSYPEKHGEGSRDKPATVKGKAWIDESSGRPMKVEYTTDPLPKHVKSMLTTLRYGVDTNAPWVIRQMIFEARGSFLFFSKRIRGDISLSDYWKYVEPAAQK